MARLIRLQQFAQPQMSRSRAPIAEWIGSGSSTSASLCCRSTTRALSPNIASWQATFGMADLARERLITLPAQTLFRQQFDAAFRQRALARHPNRDLVALLGVPDGGLRCRISAADLFPLQALPPDEIEVRLLRPAGGVPSASYSRPTRHPWAPRSASPKPWRCVRQVEAAEQRGPVTTDQLWHRATAADRLSRRHSVRTYGLCT